MMREEYKIAYEKAQEVLKLVNPKKLEMVRTASIIEAVEKLTGINVVFNDFDFSAFNTEKVDFSHYGAAMQVKCSENGGVAKILLNDRATPEMKRFSLVHELGHLITQNPETTGYQISTHIDMRINSIPEKIIKKKEFRFLVGEQIANIFALLVLIPHNILVEAMERYDSLTDIANILGVEKNAIVSRMDLTNTRELSHV